MYLFHLLTVYKLITVSPQEILVFFFLHCTELGCLPPNMITASLVRWYFMGFWDFLYLSMLINTFIYLLFGISVTAFLSLSLSVKNAP